VAAKKKVAPPKPWEISAFTDCFAFVGGHMLTGHALDNEVREWDLDVGLVLSVRRRGRKRKESVNSIAVRPGTEQFLVDCEGVLSLWALDKPAPLRDIEAHWTRALAWIDQRRFATGDMEGTLRVWDIETGEVLRQSKHGDQIIALVCDEKVAWTGGSTKVRVIKRWDLETGKLLGEMKLDVACASMARSPDGKRVASVTFGGALHVFDWASGKELAKVPKAHDDRVDKVAWTIDGKHIVSVSEFDKTLRLFDPNGKPLEVKRDLEEPARIGVGPNGVVYVAIAYERIDRFLVAKNAFVAI
jgi:WD40 repeat protein